MKLLLGLILFVIALLTISTWYESKIDPYEEGMHMNYRIDCENGYVYKILPYRQGVIQILNSDGTPLKCGHKIY